jgi:hypothetical protein
MFLVFFPLRVRLVIASPTFKSRRAWQSRLRMTWTMDCFSRNRLFSFAMDVTLWVVCCPTRCYLQQGKIPPLLPLRKGKEQNPHPTSRDQACPSLRKGVKKGVKKSLDYCFHFSYISCIW